MKKILFYLVFIIIIAFIMPLIFTNPFKTEEVVAEEEFEEKYDYGIFNKLKLLHAGTGEIEELDLDTYLCGVVASEMPADFEIEALKAQAIVARTYTIYQIKNGGKHENADMCDSSFCCQAWISKKNRMVRWDNEKAENYWNKITKAVNDTKGKIIFYGEEPINALFHSNSGGTTELALNVWGGDFPYFQTIETSGEENYSSYSSEVLISKDELIQKMLEKYSDFRIDFSKTDSIRIESINESGRVESIKIGNRIITGVEARTIFGLKSAKFTFEIIEDSVKFSVIGYGHGVGLSQCGSDALAKAGMNYEDIIKHYYKDVEIHE